MKKRFTEAQIVGFLREADAGVAVKDLCRRHGFSEASYYLWRSKFGGMSAPDAQAPEGAGDGERPAEEAPGRAGPRERGHQGHPAKKSGDRAGPAWAGAAHDRSGLKR